jgi:hypothetical protein
MTGDGPTSTRQANIENIEDIEARLSRAEMIHRSIASVNAAAGYRQIAIEGAQGFLRGINIYGGPEAFDEAAEKWQAMLAGLLHAIEDDQFNLQLALELAHADVASITASRDSVVAGQVSSARRGDGAAIVASDETEVPPTREASSARLVRALALTELAQAEYDAAWAENTERTTAVPSNSTKRCRD